MQTYLIIITHLLPNDSNGLKGVSGSILLHAVVKMVKVCFLQHGIQSVRSLKALYTLPPGRPVHSDTNSAALGSILAMQQLRAMTNHSDFQHCLYSQVLIYTAEWTEATWRDRKCPNLKTVAKGGFKPGLYRL